MKNFYSKITKKHQPYLLNGLTLIELIVTLTIIAILAAVSFNNMGSNSRRKMIVDETTDIILTQLYNASSTSVAYPTTPVILCSMQKGSQTTTSSCDTSATTNWNNINGIKFNSIVTVTPPSSMHSITYSNGVVSMASGVNNITITINGKIEDNTCKNGTTSIIPINTITIWKNGVIDVNKNC